MSRFESPVGVSLRRPAVPAAGRFRSPLASLAWVALALMAGSSPVLAGTSNLTVEVHSKLTPPPLLDVVSPSASTCTFPTLVKGCATAAYSIGIKNDTPGNVSNAWFHATTYVVDANGATTSYKAQFLTVPTPSCLISADSTTIACNIGNVRSGQAAPTFIVTVHSPPVTVLNHRIKLEWDIPSGQGASGSLAPVSSSTAQSSTPPSFTLIGDPPTPTKATTRSWVTGAKVLYTGNDDIATSANLATVTASLPKAPDGNVAMLKSEVTEETFCTTSDFPKCIHYTLDIPGAFGDGTVLNDLLDIILQRDVLTIKKGARAANIVIYHQAETNGPLLPIPDCDPLTGLLPLPAAGYDNGRCIYLREELPKNAGNALKGDFKVKIRGKSNGRFSW